MGASQGRGSWVLANVVGQVAFGLFCMAICLPALASWPATFGAGAGAVQLTVSGFAAAYGGMQLLYGPWSDRIGRRPVLLTGLALAIAGSLLAMQAAHIGVLVAARVLQGAGCAACMVCGRALAQDAFEGGARTRALALAAITMGLMPPAATLLGGELAVRFGWRSAFAACAGVGLVLLAAGWRLPAARRAPAQATAVHDLIAGYRTLLRQPRFKWFALQLASSTGTFYAYLAGAPVALAGQGIAPDRIGWYVMAPCLAFIAGSLLAARLARKHPDLHIVMAGQAVAGIGCVLLVGAALSGPATPLAVTWPVAVLAVGHGLIVPPSLAGTVGLVPALAGTAAALAGLAQQLGGALGSYTAAFAPQLAQLGLPMLLSAWSLAGAVAQLVLRAKRTLVEQA